MNSKLVDLVDKVSCKLYDSSARPAIRDVANILDRYWFDKSIFFVELPTGYGKTTLSIAISVLTRNIGFKTIIAYPVRTLLEDQFDKFRVFFEQDILGKRYMHNPDSKYLIKPVTLTTIDTLSMVMFGISPEDLNRVLREYWKKWSGTLESTLGHYLFSWASHALSTIILDEFHLLTDTTKSLTFSLALLKLALHNDQRVVVLSATLPNAMIDVLNRELSGYRDKIIVVSFTKQVNDVSKEVGFNQFSVYDEEYTNSRLSKKYSINLEKLDSNTKFDKIKLWIEREMGKFSRVIVVFNTVNDAVDFYKNIKDLEVPKILLHSRFTEVDRKEKINRLKKMISQDNYIVVSTQVIEVGVDISSNLFISELAPASSLIQRLGRFLRRDGESSGKVYLWYESLGEKSYKVYNAELIAKTLSLIEKLRKDENGTIRSISFHSPIGNNEKYGYKYLLNNAYSSSYYKIDRYALDKMLRILLNPTSGVIEAVKLFVKAENSFVREEFLIPVTPRSLISNLDIYSSADVFIKAAVIGIPLKTFMKLIHNDEISEFVYFDRGSGDLEIGRISEEELARLCSWTNPWIRISRLIIDKEILGFVVNLNYSKEFGLEVT